MKTLPHTLRAEHFRYEGLLQEVSDAFIETDANSTVCAVTLAAAKLLGRNADYMTGRPIAKYARRYERSAFECAISAAFAGGGSEQKLGVRVRPGLPAVSAAAVAIKDDAGTVLGLLWRVQQDT